MKKDEIPEEKKPHVRPFGVSSALKSGGHNRYVVRGIDCDAPFEDSRRFRDFEALRNALVHRWPGLYIPALPENKFLQGK